MRQFPLPWWEIVGWIVIGIVFVISLRLLT